MAFARSFCVLLVAALGLIACGGGAPPAVAPTATPYIMPPEPSDSCVLKPGVEVSFSLSGSVPSDASFRWQAQSGTFVPDDQAATLYTPASFPSARPVTIIVAVTSGGVTTNYPLPCTVEADPNATAVPTATAVSPAQATPTQAAASPAETTPTQAAALPPETTSTQAAASPAETTPTAEAGALPAPFALGLGGASEPGPDDVLIAIVSTFSGNPPLRGLDIFRAGQIVAEDQTLAAQLAPLNRTVWLVPHDDKGDPAEGERIARELVADQRYIAVVGHNRSGVLERALPVYNAAGLPVITVAATKKELTTGPANSNNVLTRVVGRDDVQAVVAAEYISGQLADELQKETPRVYVVYDDSAYGIGLRDEFARRAQTGLRTVGSEPYSEDAVNAIVNRLVLETPDVIFFPGYDTQAGPFINALAAAYASRPELTRPIFFGTDGVDTPNLAALAGEAAVGVRYSSVYMSEQDLKDREAQQGLPSISDLYKGRFAVAPASLLGESSDGMLLCLTALGRVGADGNVTREELRRNIREPFRGRTGNYTFTAQGDPGQSFYYVRTVVSALPADWDQNPSTTFPVRPPQP